MTVTVTLTVNYDALEEEEEEIYYKIISMLNMIRMSRRTSIEARVPQYLDFLCPVESTF